MHNVICIRGKATKIEHVCKTKKSVFQILIIKLYFEFSDLVNHFIFFKYEY